MSLAALPTSCGLLGDDPEAKDAGGSDDSEKQSCERGDEGCPCYGNDTCNGTLTCLSRLCVDTSGTKDDDREDDDEAETDDAGAGEDEARDDDEAPADDSVEDAVDDGNGDDEARDVDASVVDDVSDDSADEVTDEAADESALDESSDEPTDEASDEVTDEAADESALDESSDEAADEITDEVTDEAADESALDESSDEGPVDESVDDLATDDAATDDASTGDDSDVMCEPTGSCVDGTGMDCAEDGPVERDCTGCALLQGCTDCCQGLGYFALHNVAPFPLVPEVISSFEQSGSVAVLDVNFSSYSQIAAITFDLETPLELQPYALSAELLFSGAAWSPSVSFEYNTEVEDSGCLYEMTTDGDGVWYPYYYVSCWGAFEGLLEPTLVTSISLRVDALSVGAAQLALYSVSL